MNFRRERVTRGTRPELDDDQLRYFADGTDFCFFWDEWERERDWRVIRDDFLRDWIQEHAGTRPFAWWHFDAPEPRRRLGGVGDLVPAYAHPMNLRFGIFRKSHFVDEELLRAVAPVGGHLVPFDENDPPKYEAQASFLQRRKLFLPGEEKRLTAADFADEVIL